MKLAIIFCILGAMLLQCQASPVQLVENHALVAKVKALGRQAVNNDVAPAVSSSGDDDDDDEDDDDETDLGDLVDDDDDDDDEEDDTPQGQAAPAASDDEEEDDDEEDDYLDRIFDDILEDDDDEDDDDDSTNTVAQAVQPAPAAAVQSVPAVSDALDTPVGDSEPLAAGQSADYPAEDISSTTQKTVAAPAAAALSSANDDDEDDDDEDDITGALEDDDDGDDDEAEDDDDDDDIVGDGVIEARRARALKSSNPKEKTMKDALQERHNAFVDAIFERINKIVAESYDPFKVRLTGNRNQKKSKNQDKQRKSKKSRSLSDANTMAATSDNDMQKITSEPESIESEKTFENDAEVRTTSDQKKAYAAGNGAVASGKTAQKKKTKLNDDDKSRRAEGTLYGMASLKRVGNVKMVTDPQGKNSTIKSKFTLGPLTLKVEKSFKRGNVRSVKSASAKTNEMIGRIKFQVVNDSATLMSIKVQQPKQVEVESKDNHDRTRELVWKGTPQIAHFVSEKLKDATLTLFAPAGPEVVHL